VSKHVSISILDVLDLKSLEDKVSKFRRNLSV